MSPNVKRIVLLRLQDIQSALAESDLYVTDAIVKAADSLLGGAERESPHGFAFFATSTGIKCQQLVAAIVSIVTVAAGYQQLTAAPPAAVVKQIETNIHVENLDGVVIVKVPVQSAHEDDEVIDGEIVNGLFTIEGVVGV